MYFLKIINPNKVSESKSTFNKLKNKPQEFYLFD